MRTLIALLVTVLATSVAEARDRTVPHHFQHLHPCPSTGRTTGACPGYVRDHIVPLCKGGPDTVHNMHWQTTATAKAKDKSECR
jgi:hypothetical protein